MRPRSRGVDGEKEAGDQFGLRILIGTARATETGNPRYHKNSASLLWAGLQDHRKKSLSDRNTDWLEHRSTRTIGASVLIAEDSEADIFFLLRAFATSKVRNPVHVVRTGAEAIQYLSGEGKYGNREQYPLPNIVLLDLKMPTPDGLDVLRWKQTQPSLSKILWVALSNFDGIKTINEAYSAGATTFLTKPLDGKDVQHLIEGFNDYWQLQLEGDARVLTHAGASA
jgi:CheY-like chemotaxis protein